MKHHGKRIALGAIAMIGAIGAVSTGAVAGYHQSRDVTITQVGSSWSVTGHIGAARNSADQHQSLECWHMITLSNGLEYAGCSASDANGLFAACYSDDPRIIHAIVHVVSDAEVVFEADASGKCRSVRFNVGSSLPVKSP